MKALATLFLLPLAVGGTSAFEVEGVCYVDSEIVACWAPDGGPKPGLADEVRRRLEGTKTTLSFVPGRKNRFAILRQGGDKSVVSAGASRLFSLGTDAPFSVLRIAAAPEARTARATLTVERPQGAPVDVPFRAGAKAAVAGVRVEIGPVEKGVSGRPYGSPPIWGRWRFPLGVGETAPPAGLWIEPIGHDGKPIVYVDPEGRPVDAKKGEALWNEARKAGRWPAFPPARSVEIFVQPGQPLAWVGLMVDPKAVRALRMRRVGQRTETLGPLALEPQS